MAIRAAILADTHGFLDPRIAGLVGECDVAVHAGDIGGAEVLLALSPRTETAAIRGNNDTSDRWGGGEQNLLATLPYTTTVDLPGGMLRVIHGDDSGTVAERKRRYRRHYNEADAVVYGHSHRLAVDQSSLPWLLNPGAAGRTRTYGGPSCLVLVCQPGRWFVEEHRFEPLQEPANRRRQGRRAGLGGSST